ncbi:hypothetical protein M2146_002540 [Lachnospiraceae bacterium PF1-22]
MEESVKEYAEKRISESGIRRVPGHYPNFKSNEEVDHFIKSSLRAFKDAYSDSFENDDID